MPRSAAPIGPVRVLQVEDSELDAELIAGQLLEAGLEAEFLRVDSGDELRRVISGYVPDLVLSDLSMPGFDGHEALRIVRQALPTVPFIFVSGTMGEETAVQALREGADDYILKDKTARLPTAAARAIREARIEADRERVQKELLRSQRLDCLAMLAAGLSHDLRNILQPLLIVPDLLAAHSDNPRIQKLGEVVAECGRRGHEMAESMLSFVRGSRAARERIPMSPLLQAVQLLLQGTLPRKVRLEVEEPAADLLVDANYTELQQCLLNLCLNSIQAMPDHGTLSLSADRIEEAGASWVRIRVADTGTGMDAQTLAQLFTPFFTTKGDGTGLGLMSCKRIVESYGGSIGVSSTPGTGSTFEIRLPEATEEDAGLLDSEEGHVQRILIVDADATRLSLLAHALSSQGYHPWPAHDALMAMHVINEAVPALLIIDGEIVAGAGARLLHALGGMGYAGPVIVLQDEARPLASDAFPAGMTTKLLGKPLEMRQVFHVVEQALQAPGG